MYKIAVTVSECADFKNYIKHVNLVHMHIVSLKMKNENKLSKAKLFRFKSFYLLFFFFI